VILDEATYLPSLGFASAGEILDAVNPRPPGTHVLLTGRNAAPELVEAADMVTEMKEVKHPYNAGVKARKGIEY
jgi:cob(I)alamin adenosyltransferase